MIIARRNQGNAWRGLPRCRDLFGHFEAGQMAAFTGFRTLTDLDFDEVDGVQKADVHTETCRRNLLPAMVGVEAHNIAQFTAFTVDTQDVQAERGFRI